MRPLCFISLLLLLLAAPGAADTLDDALAKAGLKRADLGWTPRGWWSRWPRPVRHKLQHFDDLFAEPLATVPFTRTMANAVRQHLGPGGLDKKGTRGSGALYALVYALGVERKYGGFRSYNANLIAEQAPLDEAIVRLYRYAGRKTKFVTFGTESPYPLIEKELKEAAGKLPPELSKVLGKLVLDIVDAHHWATLAFRNVSLEDRVAVSKRLGLGAEAVLPAVPGLWRPGEMGEPAFSYETGSPQGEGGWIQRGHWAKPGKTSTCGPGEIQ